MNRATSRTFRTSEGEAVVLPPDMAYGEGVELALERSGDVVTIRPLRASRRALSGRELVEALKEAPLVGTFGPRDEEPPPDREGL